MSPAAGACLALLDFRESVSRFLESRATGVGVVGAHLLRAVASELHRDRLGYISVF